MTFRHFKKHVQSFVSKEVDICKSACILVISCVLLVSCSGNIEHKYSNRLAQATSPYLKEHADNPVDWYEWGTEALEKSKREGKPLLISIGYASCHWCHVMEQESFMDTAVARVMNQNFVCIKIDREERPDIDQIYISAAQLISGNSGWPLNAFALPDGKPFYAGTYYPKDQWLKLLAQIITLYNEDEAKLVKQANAITRGVVESDLISSSTGNQEEGNNIALQNSIDKLLAEIDFQSGGLTGEPKFPMPVIWEFLLQEYYVTKNPRMLEAVETTLERMARGGLYDQLGGGFARYSTDANWRIPHFEKMLYDNGQLVSLYTHAYQVTGKQSYENVAKETLQFIERELTSPEGGFYSSINADSEGEEGAFYVWKKSEVEKVFDKKTAEVVIDYFNITQNGNWESGKNVLYVESSTQELSRKYNIPLSDIEKLIGDAKSKLQNERNNRPRPSLDDKVLTSWNALMMMGYIDAYLGFGDNHYLEVAKRNASFIKDKLVQSDGKLWRSYSQGKSSIDGFLDDYSNLANAYIKLYQATFEIEWLNLARTLADYAVQHFRDNESGFFYYSSDELIIRKMETTDHVIPSSNAIMAEVLFKLGHYYDHEGYLLMSKQMTSKMIPTIEQNPTYYAHWLTLERRIGFNPFEVAIMGESSMDRNKEMMKNYLPTALLMGGNEENLPLLENKLVHGKTIIYVCRNKVCKLPVQDVTSAIRQMNGE